jgi:hypothetical protein
MRPLLVSFALWGLVGSGCVSPPPPSELAADAARDLNLAARFGQLGAAASHTAAGAREGFLERRAQWGKSLRIVDTELAGFEMDRHDNAKVYVDVTWLRADELTVRSTRIAQFWRDHRVGGWLLVREKRVDGDIGLFGEAVQRSPVRAKDVHFPTTTIRE